jgi:hypothetical protein
MWLRVDIVFADVSEERIASILRVEEKRRNPRANRLLALLTLVRSRFYSFFFYPEDGGDTFL